MRTALNPFWQQRSRYKPGKIFSSPAMLWKAAQEYFAYIDAAYTPAKKAGKKGVPSPDADEGVMPIIQTNMPYSLQGLCVFLGVPYKTFVEDTQGDGKEAFEETVRFIKDIIETQQFTGAVLGMFNATTINRKAADDEANTGEDDTDWKITLKLDDVEDVI